ncbi:MAG: formylglycine-generating enzyme family protein [Anaerolineae bacterium]
MNEEPNYSSSVRASHRILTVGIVALLATSALVYLGIIRDQVPSPSTQDLSPTLVDARGVAMVLVPDGPFTMGVDPDAAIAECEQLGASPCDREDFADAAPPHLVTLGAFYIDTYEVTNEQYAKCVAAGTCAPPSDTKSYTRDSYYGDPQFADYPVILVNWFDAQTHCEWRGARLPTEAEWEKAARGSEGRLYPWGNSFLPGRANLCDRNCGFPWADRGQDDGHADTAPVGTYPDGESPYGAHDLAGNVWEWVADRYGSDYYLLSPPVNPQGPSEEAFRVARGGAWFSPAIAIAAPYRLANVPTARYHLVGGFRCALPA